MSDPESRFSACWYADAGQVTAYATRHVGPEEAKDVLAETFLQAWRRWDDVPDPALPWLIGTARRVMANQRRSSRRRDALALRLQRLDVAARPSDDLALNVLERRQALESLAALDEPQREALLLVAWDGLTTQQAGVVLGVRAATVRTRVHRARRALQALDPPSLTRSVLTTTPIGGDR